MTILATGPRQDGIEFDGVRPLTRLARQVHNAFGYALTEVGVSRAQRGRAEELDRSSNLTKAMDLQVDVFEDARLTASRGEVLKVA
jgi:hypothetical protein